MPLESYGYHTAILTEMPEGGITVYKEAYKKITEYF